MAQKQKDQDNQWIKDHADEVEQSQLTSEQLLAIPMPYRSKALHDSAVYQPLFSTSETIEDIKKALHQRAVRAGRGGGIQYTLAEHLFGQNAEDTRDRIIKSGLSFTQLGYVHNECFWKAVDNAHKLLTLIEVEGEFIGNEGSIPLSHYVFHLSGQADFILDHATELTTVMKVSKLGLDDLLGTFCEEDLLMLAKLDEAPLACFVRRVAILRKDDAENVAPDESEPVFDRAKAPQSELLMAWKKKHPINRVFRFPIKALMEADDKQYRWIMSHQNMFLVPIYRGGFYDRERVGAHSDLIDPYVWPHREWLYTNRSLINQVFAKSSRKDILDQCVSPKGLINLWRDRRRYALWVFSTIGFSALAAGSFVLSAVAHWSNIEVSHIAPIVLAFLGLVFVAIAIASLVKTIDYHKEKPIIFARFPSEGKAQQLTSIQKRGSTQ